MKLPEMLLATLEYWREYRTYAHIGASYGVDESNVFRTIKWVENVLIKDGTFSLPGKKKRHTLKTQVVVDKGTRQVICTSFANGKKHDLRLYKDSKLQIYQKIKSLVDTGYLGIAKLHKNSLLPKKKSRKNPLTKEDKAFNRLVSSDRIINENVIGFIKRFKILAKRYRNRRKRFALRFNLIAGLCNFDTKL